MDFVSDLHLHSKYARAVSQHMILPVMAEYARKKGINILSVADFTHPLWFKELKANLTEVSDGLYKVKGREKLGGEPFFIFSVEIANIYSHNGKLRRIHNLLFAPSMEVADKVNGTLSKHGANLLSDGRPMMGLTSKQVLELILGVDERCFLIPCHAWTPHFGIYGSASGYDSLEECFGELTKYIYAIETGLSSDPVMNWQIPELEKRAILSFSDAHSPGKMGREATVFELSEPSFENIREAIMKPSLKKDDENHLSLNRVKYTLEFYPEEGKYHYTGHRNCNVSLTPQETQKNGTTCPVCKRRLTEGVMVRVDALTKQMDGQIGLTPKVIANDKGLKWKVDPTKKQPPYVSLVPLLEIIKEALGVGDASQKVKDLFDQLTKSVGSELEILLRADIVTIEHKAGSRVAEGVKKVREGDIVIEPGYDGVYGVVKIWKENNTIVVGENTAQESQLGLEF